MKRIITPFTEKAKILNDGESIQLVPNTVKDKNHTVFSCRLSELSEGATVIVGHGYNERNAGWVEIKRDTVSAYNYYSWKDPNQVEITPPTAHGLKIADTLTVVIDKDTVRGDEVTIYSASGSFKASVKGISGFDGSPLALADRCTLTDCTLSWTSEAYASPIWIFGDSYLGHTDDCRWPYYLYADGFTDLLLSGYPGENSERAIEDFKLAVTKGTPEFALWLLGMNNGDGESSDPNPKWLEVVEEFLAICNERGITPILSTIPTTPKINNAPKSAWVKASGYRYIDFERAVGADLDPAWFEGMLSSDDVHPDPLGAKALYARVLADFPEIMRR